MRVIILAMDRFLEVTKLIEAAQAKGVNFGKSNPYNRLRYYTKMGLLPHMERRRNSSGSIVGHYPEWALDRLIYIEKLKDEGMENTEIGKRIEEKHAKQNTVKALTNPRIRNKFFIYSIILILIAVFAAELRIIPLGINKYKSLSTKPLLETTNVGHAGNSFIPANTNTVFVGYENIEVLSKIIVTFTQDYSPATKYWIQKIEPGKGFVLELDTKVFNDTWFNWYAYL